jgi:hypothetical protein
MLGVIEIHKHCTVSARLVFNDFIYLDYSEVLRVAINSIEGSMYLKAVSARLVLNDFI